MRSWYCATARLISIARQKDLGERHNFKQTSHFLLNKLDNLNEEDEKCKS